MIYIHGSISRSIIDKTNNKFKDEKLESEDILSFRELIHGNGGYIYKYRCILIRLYVDRVTYTSNSGDDYENSTSSGSDFMRWKEKYDAMLLVTGSFSLLGTTPFENSRSSCVANFSRAGK